jgi:hypothetical protein
MSVPLNLVLDPNHQNKRFYTARKRILMCEFNH